MRQIKWNRSVFGDGNFARTHKISFALMTLLSKSNLFVLRFLVSSVTNKSQIRKKVVVGFFSFTFFVVYTKKMSPDSWQLFFPRNIMSKCLGKCTFAGISYRLMWSYWKRFIHIFNGMNFWLKKKMRGLTFNTTKIDKPHWHGGEKIFYMYVR